MDINIILETKNLTKAYGKNTVVDSVNMMILSGQIYGLLGKTGSGKTTIMCMLLNFIKRTEGSIKIFNKEVDSSTSDVYKKVGSIIDDSSFYPNLTAKENLELFCKLYKIKDKSIINRVLKLVSLFNEKDKLVRDYSSGMKRRLSIALSLVKRPDFLILDEPFRDIPSDEIKEIQYILRRLADEKGTGILISSHILSEIEQLADVIGVLDEGEIVEEVSMKRLKDVISKYILIQVSDVDAAKEALIRFGLIENKDFNIISNTDIEVYTNLESRSKLNRFLNDQKIDVFTIKLVNENLEEYFANLFKKLGVNK